MISRGTIRIMCPNLTCRKVLAVPQAARGKTIRCRSCSTNIKVPIDTSGSNAGPKPSSDNKAA